MANGKVAEEEAEKRKEGERSKGGDHGRRVYRQGKGWCEERSCKVD